MIRIWDYLTSLGYHNCWDISGWDILVLFIATLNYTHPLLYLTHYISISIIEFPVSVSIPSQD